MERQSRGTRQRETPGERMRRRYSRERSEEQVRSEVRPCERCGGEGGRYREEFRRFGCRPCYVEVCRVSGVEPQGSE